MAKKHRDDFSPKTVLQIAKRAGWLCSYPTCRTPTVGATSDGEGEINIGTAAHICAAASGGPRYDDDMSPEERSSASNGIWMCRDHGKAIDSTDPEFTVQRLREWKRQAEFDSCQRVLRHEAAHTPPVAGDGQLLQRIRSAAEADLQVFEKTAKWPSASVELRLSVDGVADTLTTSVLADAVTSLDDLILVAPPGTGKTTTLFQIASAMLANGTGTPFIVQLGDWATESTPILTSILTRPAFRAISENDFREAATQPGMVLLLDGWNELDLETRKRARVQIDTITAELPALGLVVSTRRQALDIPFGGKRVDILPLDEKQQMQIARARRNDAGEELLDRAWRTRGVCELVTIPLYLTALLSLPKNAPFPLTKEEVFRHFVGAHQTEPSRAEALYAITQGFHQEYLIGLASSATRTGNTAISDTNARRSVSQTATFLANNAQILSRPEPAAVLNVLVSTHVLMRAGESPGYSFQHQQFQEWYASHHVERRIIDGADDSTEREALKAEVFNLPAWEESILFAVERLARGKTEQRLACGKAIIAAFEVDPILASEMIFRSTDEVWAQVSAPIHRLLARWYTPGTADRAFRFMLTSGRPEFLGVIWPLITDEREQVSLRALRHCRSFRPSILGADAVENIKSLPTHARTVLLSEMARGSGVDGLDLATAIAKHDPNPEVRAAVIDALAFRRAERHVASVLRDSSDETFDLVVRSGIVDEISDELVRKKLDAARQRQAAKDSSDYDRLLRLMYAQDANSRIAELIDLISTARITDAHDPIISSIYEAYHHYPGAVADALLERVRTGRSLFYHADELLASARLRLEDDTLVELALAEPQRPNYRADAAASALGPVAAGRVVDALLDADAQLRDAGGAHKKDASVRYRDNIQARISHISGDSLVSAVRERSAQADNDQIARMALLLSRRSDVLTGRVSPFDAASLQIIQTLVQNWGERMLASKSALRWHKGAIATLACHAPSVVLLPILKRLLDDNLVWYRAFREEAESTGWVGGDAVNEARTPMTHEYQRAFMAIKASETVLLMTEYLEDEYFGACAAQVLVHQWHEENEPPKDTHFVSGVDFSSVKEKRALRALHPDATSNEAEAIIMAIERLMSDHATEEQKMLSVALGISAFRLPHGQHDATIRKLIGVAPRHAHNCARSDLLLSLVLSGEEIDIKDVAKGIDETFQAAKMQMWILTESDGYQLKRWLRLLPFVKHPVEALDVLRSMPAAQRTPQFLEEMIGVLADAPSTEAEDLLFRLAEEDASFYQNHRWRSVALRLGTASAAQRVIDLTINGAFDARGFDERHWSRELGALISEFPEVRRQVYRGLRAARPSTILTLLARAVSESPDVEGLLLLVDIENKHKVSVLSWHTVENVVTKHVPAENWSNAFEIVPVAAVELRRELLAMTTDGCRSDAAARCLNMIDTIRDERGVPAFEPRHPDLASGKPWPIMTANGC